MDKIESTARKSPLLLVLALSLSLTASGVTALSLCSSPALAASKKLKSEDRDGLEPSVRQLVNRGQWTDAIAKLEAISASKETADRDLAWLAFGYLYTGKQKELKELDEKVKKMNVNGADPNCAAIIHAFSLVVQGKHDDAEKVLDVLNEPANGDALLDFAKACVCLKKGNAGKAAEYCEKLVGLCPNFAWGYRTLGFIQDKSLKNAQLAQLAYEHALLIEPNFKDVRGLLVDVMLSHNDFDGAIASAQEAIKLFPKDAGNYYRLAQIYQQQWRLIEALEQLKKGVALASDDPRFYRSMASIYRYQGKMAEAIAEQQKSVKLGKDKAFELIELASLQEQDKNTAAAIESLKQAIKEAPANMVAHQKLVGLLKKEGRKDDLLAELKRVVEQDPKNEGLRLGLAEAYKQAGKIDEAIEQLKEAANLEQKDPRPHREVAKIELERKNYLAAAKSYTRALNINPASVDDLVALGFCYASNNDYMQAETAFTTGLALQQLGSSAGVASSVNPNDIMRSLSSVLFTEGRYREAVVTLEAVVLAEKDGAQKKLDQFMCSEGKALRDRNSESLKELQSSFDALDKKTQLDNLSDMFDSLLKLGKKELALETVKKYAESEIKQSCPLVLAMSLLVQDRTKEAKELLHKIIDESKDKAELASSAYVELSKALQKDGDRKAAIEALQRAIEVNPKDFDANVSLSRSYLSDKNFSDCQQAAKKALEINPYCVPAYLVLAECSAAQDNLKEAEGFFAKAAELYPTSMEAHKGLLSVFQKQSKTTEAQREQEIISNLSKNG